MIYIFGAASSGKSEYAENRLCEISTKRVYLATMKAKDAESMLRVENHRILRKDRGFRTIEKTRHIAEAKVYLDEAVLLECLSNLLANTMFPEREKIRGAEECAREIISDIEYLLQKAGHLVIVGNDVFDRTKQYDRYTEEYIRSLQKIHRWLIERADEVTEIIFGIAYPHKKECEG